MDEEKYKRKRLGLIFVCELRLKEVKEGRKKRNRGKGG